MPFLLLLIILVGLFAWNFMRRRPFGAARCHWVSVAPFRNSGLQEFRCSTCGETGYSAQKSGPANCLRHIRARKL